AGLFRAGREKISLGNRVSAIRLGMNAQDLSAEVVGVGSAALVVKVRSARPFISLSEQPVACVVAYREIQIAIFIPCSASPRVIRILPVDRDLQQYFFGAVDKPIIDKLISRKAKDALVQR